VRPPALTPQSALQHLTNLTFFDRADNEACSLATANGISQNKPDDFPGICAKVCAVLPQRPAIGRSKKLSAAGRIFALFSTEPTYRTNRA
jgi:hypothetical protein